jgi:hypothetical protein
MVLLSPEGSSPETLARLAPRRFNGHDGFRLGLLGNTKLNADEILIAVGDLLSERFQVKSVIHRAKPTFSQPAPPELVDEMVASCDIVLAGVGD